MTGKVMGGRRRLKAFSAILAVFAITGCDENGNFAFPTATDANEDTTVGRAAQPVQGNAVTQDVERPDIFEITDRGLWDGRPSLGGIWVAHPDADDPNRVVIRNPANGQSVIGALFRRERENPGPPLQISSDAANALGILAGAPTEISVVALMREEVEIEAPEDINPVIASLETPVNVEQTPLEPAKPADPIAGAAAAIAAAENTVADAGTTAVAAGASTAAGAAAAALNSTPADDAEAAPDAGETPPPEPPALAGRLVQIGVFSIQDNAENAAARLRDAGVPTTVLPQQAGGRTVWRVVSGPAADADAQTAMLATIKDAGFPDAFGFEG